MCAMWLFDQVIILGGLGWPAYEQGAHFAQCVPCRPK